VLPAVALLLALAVPSATAAEPIPELEGLSFNASGSGVTIVLKASRPLGKFRCGLPSATSSDVSIEFPGATSKLQARYPLDGRLLKEAIVESGTANGQGPRVRFVVARGILSGLDQSSSGMELRFEEDARAAVENHGTEAQAYRIGVGDKLEIAVFGHDDLSKVVEVRSDGSINYPLIGDVQVKGMTVSEVDDQITRVLGKDFLVDPQVSVDVREYQSQWVTVIGEVRNPGRFMLRRNMRLIDVLAEAGGVTKEAGVEILVTRRTDAGDTRQILLDRERLLSQENQDANILLSHMDIVTVGEKKIFYIRGEVTRPGSYFLESGLSIMKAISVAGGLTPYANRKEVQLIRAGAGGAVGDTKVVNLKAIEEGKKPDIPLLPNDVIIVPRRIF
jgi:polysaccharide export outer membrane protein